MRGRSSGRRREAEASEAGEYQTTVWKKIMLHNSPALQTDEAGEEMADIGSYPST